MFQPTSSHIETTARTDAIVHLKLTYDGELDTPAKYNAAAAHVLRAMAEVIEATTDRWVDPTVHFWLHNPGEITAEVMLSEMDNEASASDQA